MASVTMSVEDLKDRYEGDLTTRFTETYLTTKVADAVALVNGECPTVPTRLESGALAPNNYKRIIADVILRVIRNPDGYAAENEGGAGYSRLPVVASGNLWLTQADIDTLNGVARRGRTVPATVGIGAEVGWGK